MSLTVSAWINAVATVIVAFGVVTAVYYVRKAFGTKQRELVAQLTDATRLHASALRLSVDERRRAQACHVFIDLDRSTPLKQVPASPNAPDAAATPWRITATVHNASSQPVYDLYVIWQLGTERMGRPDPTTKLMPGQQVCFERGPFGRRCWPRGATPYQPPPIGNGDRPEFPDRLPDLPRRGRGPVDGKRRRHAHRHHASKR